MAFVVFLLAQCADVGSTFFAIHRGAVEGNPLGLPKVLLLKALCAVLVTLVWFRLPRYRYLFEPALYLSSGAVLLVALQNLNVIRY